VRQCEMFIPFCAMFHCAPPRGTQLTFWLTRSKIKELGPTHQSSAKIHSQMIMEPIKTKIFWQCTWLFQYRWKTAITVYCAPLSPTFTFHKWFHRILKFYYLTPLLACAPHRAQRTNAERYSVDLAKSRDPLKAPIATYVLSSRQWFCVARAAAII
jgi:hypothetical protein